MKKLIKPLFILSFSCLILNSCESNKIPSVEQEVTENFQEHEITDNQTDENQNASTEDEDTLQEDSSIDADKEQNTIEETESDNNKDGLDDIDEPLVIDFFPSDEDDDEVTLIMEDVSDTFDETDLEERIEDFEDIPPLEETSNKNSTEIPVTITSDNNSTPVNQNNINDNFATQIPDKNTTTVKNITKTDDSVTRSENHQNTQIDIVENTDTNIDNSEITPLIEILSEQAEDEYEEIIVPARKISLNQGEYIDITYPGIEWKYYGLTDDTKDIEFVELKQNATNTKITLLAKNPGTKILHFYKIDFLTDSYIDDYVEVEIIPVEKKSDKTTNKSKEGTSEVISEVHHSSAPAYKAIKNEKQLVKKEKTSDEQTDINQKDSISQTDANKKIDLDNSKNNNSKLSSNNTNDSKKTIEKTGTEKKSENANSYVQTNSVTQNQTDTQINGSDNESNKNNIQNQPNSTKEPAKINYSQYLTEAKKLYSEKKFKESLEKINEYLSASSDKRDEALYLQGQLYESQSDIKNIKAALNSYNLLTSNYPASKYWNDANKRIIYLKRFYIEGR